MPLLNPTLRWKRAGLEREGQVSNTHLRGKGGIIVLISDDSLDHNYLLVVELAFVQSHLWGELSALLVANASYNSAYFIHGWPRHHGMRHLLDTYVHVRQWITNLHKHYTSLPICIYLPTVSWRLLFNHQNKSSSGSSTRLIPTIEEKSSWLKQSVIYMQMNWLL